MAAEKSRLLSPFKRRIFTVDFDDPKSVHTGKELVRVFGWRNYNGPAVVTDQGWIVPDSDPAIAPAPAPRR